MQRGQLSLITVCLFLTLSVGAGALEEGYRAYEAGDYQTAMKYWLPLAKKNDADAMFNLGLLYKNGLGVKKSPRTAMKWFKQAASYGSADAAYNLGVMYLDREAGYPSKKDALYWWKQAAEYGHAESQYNYGVMLAYGNGTDKDVLAAIAWWKKAARQGNQNAVEALIKTYSQGLFGQTPNAAEAKYWSKFRSQH